VFVALVAAVSANHVLSEIRDRVVSAEAEKLSGQALVDHVNANQQFFKAKLSKRFAHLSETAKMKAIGGVAPSMEELSAQLDKQGRVSQHTELDTLPDFFDARDAWSGCSAIGTIRDQSSCGSCWAMATGEIISDRICIASGGSQQFMISSDDIMSCCGFTCGSGCGGGNPLAAMKFYVSHGVVTGSNYEQHAGCMPYPFEPCEHHNNNTRFTPCDNEPDFKTPTCTKTCQAGYPLTYTQDKHFGKSAYGVARKVADIQKEIFTNGPVVAAFNVYEDFEQYSSGIYVHTAGKYLGGHAVKVIGWGEENGTPYWLAVNSWNTDWGENGLFRIIRGVNEVGFEAQMVGGLPKL
ncbi:hypothetical protein PFISCL1PPCAC_2210, partial [Pristionchus fissidentatus]